MKTNKRIWSWILVVVMLISVAPFSMTATAADTSATVIGMKETWAAAGSSVQVDIYIEGNPGVIGGTLTVSWADGLTLVDDKNGKTFNGLAYQSPSRYNRAGTNFIWYGSDVEDVLDGTILTLTFEVEDGVDNDAKYLISLSGKGFTDSNENSVDIVYVSDYVRVVNYLPGDVSGDGIISPLDLVMLARYISDGCTTDPEGYNITLDELAADVDDDGELAPMDLILISRYISDGCETDPDGYNVILKPSTLRCIHASLKAVEAKDPTCTEPGNIAYWICPDCDKCFKDADGTIAIDYEETVVDAAGHNSIAFDAVPATPTTEGYTAGVWCDKCETWTFGHEVIPPIKLDESNISYRHFVQREGINGTIEIVNDEYLSTHEINNPNPVTYVEGEGVTELIEGYEIDGKKMSANGYSFLGWFERPEVNASRVYSISADAKGDKILYGVWSKNTYKITYLPDSANSKLPKVEDGSFTVDVETSLNAPPSWPNMVWIGWSDEDGKIVKSIPKGTSDNVTLTANWMSKRSQTVPNTKYSTSTPAITIDEENGIYAFAYEIGDIQNVPIQQVEEGAEGKGFNLVKGQEHRIEKTFTQKITSSEANTIADTIANATTKSDSWTLSEDWNKNTTFSQEQSNKVTQEQMSKASNSFSETGKYTISSGVGGTKEHIDETGTSTKTTKQHELGVSYEVGTSLNVGIEADLKAGVTAGTPFKNASVNAGASVDQKLGLDYKYTTSTEKETHETHTDKTSSYWNLDKSFENSNTFSATNEFSQSLSQSIEETFKYGETLDYGGSNSNTVSSSNTSSETREYASSVTYSKDEGSEITVSETFTADADTGFYRKVLAANFKVFAVVIYDMKTSSFSTMTHSLKINGSEHLFTDYSLVSSFDDYENGVLPFEVPTFVSDYVYGLVGASEGLRFDDETGVIDGYGFKDPETGICYKKYDEDTDTYSEPCDTDVIIPRYVVISINSNEKKIVPVTGIAADAFKDTTITSVYLSDRITEIPESAFENCASLKYVRGGNITAIGKNAFKNCPSLFEFELPVSVTTLGTGAFDGANALTVNVANSSVFDTALSFDVKRLSLNLGKMTDSIDGKEIVTPDNIEYFYLSGGGKTFNNVSLKSDADTVILNNITINNNVNIPLELSSENVGLEFATINSSGLIMRLDAESTVVTLDGNNYFISSSDKATLSKSLRFIEKEGSSASGKLKITGNALVFGTVTGAKQVSFDSAEHSLVYLTQQEYENMINSHYVRFDANGGTVDVDNKLVIWNSTIGELPTPVREGFTFLGWFNGDTQITEETVLTELEDVTVRAHWQSGWVKASTVAEDADIVDTKWTYNIRTTSNSSTAPSGYTQYKNPTWVWGSYGSWSNWSRTVAIESDSRQIQTQTVVSHYNKKTQYMYTRYYGWSSSNGYYLATPYSSGICTNYESTGWLDYSLAFEKTQYFGGVAYSAYGRGQINSKSIYWYNEQTRLVDNYDSPVYVSEYRYRDRSKVYTYYYQKNEPNESKTEVVASDTIANVQKWVQYQVK